LLLDLAPGDRVYLGETAALVVVSVENGEVCFVLEESPPVALPDRPAEQARALTPERGASAP
jgi:hypothetical protein